MIIPINNQTGSDQEISQLHVASDLLAQPMRYLNNTSRDPLFVPPDTSNGQSFWEKTCPENSPTDFLRGLEVRAKTSYPTSPIDWASSFTSH
jgi:hypothetical protein